MTTHFRTRNALAEIPTRMGNLRVSTPTVLRNTLDTSLDNTANNNETPTTSPDEIVIRQRGRRRVPYTWSPDKFFRKSPLKTPPKNPAPMTLRSSPRKRLLDNFNNGTPEKLFSPKKADKELSAYFNLHTGAKKLKFDEGSIIQTTSSTPLNLALKGLTNDQLINIIQGLVNEQPDLEKKIRSDFPVPDMKPMEEEVIHSKKNIFRSLPSSRITSKTDSSAYSRAALHLTEFKRSIVNQSRLLHDSNHWDALLDYSMTIWYHIRGTPVWDNFAHNATRRHCFKILAWHCLKSVRNGGISLGENRLEEFLSRINDMSKDCEDIKSSIKHLDFLLKKE